MLLRLPVWRRGRLLEIIMAFYMENPACFLYRQALTVLLECTYVRATQSIHQNFVQHTLLVSAVVPNQVF